MYEDIEQTREDDIEIIQNAQADLSLILELMERNRHFRPDPRIVNYLYLFGCAIEERVPMLRRC
ncbi:MAG TPA: hypothetical protein PKY50_06060 [Candidatus Competibacter sp.]|nr:hypothetical protein [Candidatus Competibacter sp.]